LKENVAGTVSHQPTKGDYFVFSKDIGGDEFFQSYRYEFASGAIHLLTDGKSRNSVGEWSHGADRMAYTSTRRNGRDLDLYVISPSDPKSDRRLAELEGGGWRVLDWSPDDRQILVSDYISINESYLWLFDASTGRKELITPTGGREKVSYSDAEFSKDGKGIYVTTDRDGEFLRLAYLDLATRQPRFLTSHINWDVEGFDVSPVGATIAFVTNEDGVSILRLLDTATGKEKAAPKLPAGVISRVRWHKNGNEIGFTLSSARSTSDVYSLDVGTGKLERWTFSETGGLNPQNFSEPELIRWKSFDGRPISGFLYLPPAQFRGKRPVVINIHGGPEGQSRPGFLGANNYYLNELGVALIYPNVRGSTGYGKTFLQLDNGSLREDTYKDIGALLDWIGTRPELDADRIMVTGVSYGGHMTLAVATLYSDRIRCAVDVVGPSNLASLLRDTSGYRQDLRRAEYGDERKPEMRAFLERIAPMNNAQKITKPLFVVAGQNDPRVPLSESQQIVSMVKRNGTPVWYLMAKDEGHGFAKKKNQEFQFYSTVSFMQEYLLK
jgi:dipeptidyl aminopeptidase/acylaminoacyl peptidase